MQYQQLSRFGYKDVKYLLGIESRVRGELGRKAGGYKDVKYLLGIERLCG